jgi:hypothetical protein
MRNVTRLTFRIEPDGIARELRGRYAWTLYALVEAGERGVTPIDRPAPRWSHYVDILRDREGLAIETIEERHGGPFRGWHGRYVLRTPVEILELHVSEEAA